MADANAAIDWAFARTVAKKFSHRDEFESSYHYASLEADFAELTAIAEDLVEKATGLRSAAGPARSRVTDRDGWVNANLSSFGRLLKPMTSKLEGKNVNKYLGAVGSKVTGAQVGAVLGWMSNRVLGQYDLLLVEAEDPQDQDIVYYVGPNILGLEKRFGFSPRQFRQWLALHEVTHRMQFTGVPWLRPHFISLVDQTLTLADPNPKQFVENLKRAAGEVSKGRDPLGDAGLVGLIASDDQRAVLRKVQGLMSLLEGHGDVTMTRAGLDRVPEAARFARILEDRRNSQRGPARLVQKLMGIEAKMKQYELGEIFVNEVEREGGRELFDHVWEREENLPDFAEIQTPQLWIDRMRTIVITD